MAHIQTLELMQLTKSVTVMKPYEFYLRVP